MYPPDIYICWPDRHLVNQGDDLNVWCEVMGLVGSVCIGNIVSIIGISSITSQNISRSACPDLWQSAASCLPCLAIIGFLHQLCGSWISSGLPGLLLHTQAEGYLLFSVMKMQIRNLPTTKNMSLLTVNSWDLATTTGVCIYK